MYTQFKAKLIQTHILNSRGSLHKRSEEILSNNPHLKNELFVLTCFADITDSITLRLHMIQYNITERTRCATCNNITPWCKTRKIFKRFCSKDCVDYKIILEATMKTCCIKYGGPPNSCEEIKNKKKKTNLERYGVEWTTRSNKVLEARRIKNLERYGVENVLSSHIVRDEIKQKLIEKYGVDVPAKSKEIRQKMKNTCMERYGVENVFSSIDFIEKSKQTNFDNHGFEYVLSSPNIREKIKQTTFNKYGVENVSQRSVDPNSLKLLKDPEWLYNKHIILKYTQSKIAQILNVDVSIINRYLKEANVDVCYYKQSSQAERDLVDWFNELNICTIKTNDRTLLYPNEIDVLLPEKNLAIEYNGLFWHSEQVGKDISYHSSKTNKCAYQNIDLIHIFENEWISKQNIIKSFIERRLDIAVNVIDFIYEKIQDRDIVNSFYENNSLKCSNFNNNFIGLYNTHELVCIIEFQQFSNTTSVVNIVFKNGYTIKQVDNVLSLIFSDMTNIVVVEDRRYPMFSFLSTVKDMYNTTTFPSRHYIDKKSTSIVDYETEYWIWDCGKTIYTLR